MRSGTAPVTRAAVRLGGAAVFLLALWTLGGAAPAQDDKGPPQVKGQPKPVKGKGETPKKGEAKTPPVKLGIQVNDPRALQGYTLISPFVSPNTYLLDMQGRVVHTWKTDCSPALSAMLLENGHLLRPGSIGGDANVFGPGPGVGGRIQEFTWEGELVWDFKFYNARQLPHHNMTRLPNGNVLLIVWDRKTAEEAIAAGRRPEMTGDKHLLPDSLVEIRPTGKTTGEVVWEWHLWDHLVQEFDKTKKNFGNVAQHPELVNINFGEDERPAAKDGKGKAKEDKGKAKDDKDKAKDDPKKGATPPANRPVRADPDFTHCNGVAYNADLDQVVISVWKFSEFWIIDHSTTTAEAAGHTGGRYGKGGDLLYRWGNPRAYRAGTKADQKLFSQHNAHWIPHGLPGAGHLLVFNNGPGRPGGNHSSVDELVLPADAQGHYLFKPGAAFGPDRPIWSYTAPKKEEFFSSFISGAQRLVNGNTLICSGANGTIFEVTPQKEVVWKYINPAKGGPPSGSVPRPGQILTPIAGDLLAISPEQRLHLDEIQKDIDAHLDKLLSADQKKQAGERDGGFGLPRQPGMVMTASEQGRLKLTDEQKKDLTALQKAVEGRFDRVLSDAQRKQIKSVFAPFGPGRAFPPPGNAGGPQPGKILSPGQQETLKLSPEQKKRLGEIQKEIDAKLETLLTEGQKQHLQAMRFAPPGGRVVGPAGPGRGPAGGTPLFRAYRYAIDFPGFAGKTLTPGRPLEDEQPKAPEKKVSESKK
jgi:hypothetical protein